jgi:hypothetical protein
MFAILKFLMYEMTPCRYLKGLYKEEEWLKLNANEGYNGKLKNVMFGWILKIRTLLVHIPNMLFIDQCFILNFLFFLLKFKCILDG